jgi:hypothetical protein
MCMTSSWLHYFSNLHEGRLHDVFSTFITFQIFMKVDFMTYSRLSLLFKSSWRWISWCILNFHYFSNLHEGRFHHLEYFLWNLCKWLSYDFRRLSAHFYSNSNLYPLFIYGFCTSRLKFPNFCSPILYESSLDAIWIKIIHHISIHNGSLESKRYIFGSFQWWIYHTKGFETLSYNSLWPLPPLSQMLLHLINSII